MSRLLISKLLSQVHQLCFQIAKLLVIQSCSWNWVSAYSPDTIDYFLKLLFLFSDSVAGSLALISQKCHLFPQLWDLLFLIVILQFEDLEHLLYQVVGLLIILNILLALTFKMFQSICNVFQVSAPVEYLWLDSRANRLDLDGLIFIIRVVWDFQVGKRLLG